MGGAATNAPTITWYNQDSCTGTASSITVGSPLSCSADSDGRYTNFLCASYFPSAAPSRLPTGPSVKPSTQPTSTPTIGSRTGYAVQSSYVDATCSTTAAKINVYKIGSCIPDSPFGLPAMFTHYMAGDGSSGTIGFVLGIYLDGACTIPAAGPNPVTIPVGCQGAQSWAYSAVQPAMPTAAGSLVA